MLMPWVLDCNPKGIIHVGANTGEELEFYKQKPSIKNVVWIEGNKAVIEQLRNNVESYSGHFVINEVVSDLDYNDVNFYLNSNQACSSILPIGKHLDIHPSMQEVRIDKVISRTVDSLLYEYQYKPEGFDFVNLDVQGAELLVLKGMKDFLRNIKYIYTEVNFDELYKGCALVNEIDDFLANLGFKGIAMADTGLNWGDKFYAKS